MSEILRRSDPDPEEPSEEDIDRYIKIGDYVADQLNPDSDMTDEEWNRCYQEGIDYYYNEGHPLPSQD
jgi:hypothetical protein